MGLALNDIVLITIGAVVEQQRVLFTHTVRTSTAPSGGTTVLQDLAALAGFLDGATPGNLAAQWLACVPDNVTLDWVQAQAIYPTRSAYWREPYSLAGTWEGNPATLTNVCGVITLGTEKAGRSQVANKHVGPLSPDAFVDGTIGATAFAALGNLGLALRNQIVVPDSGTYTPIIYHRNGDGAAAKRDDVIRAQVQNTARVIRRRTVGLGI